MSAVGSTEEMWIVWDTTVPPTMQRGPIGREAAVREEVRGSPQDPAFVRPRDSDPIRGETPVRDR